MVDDRLGRLVRAQPRQPLEAGQEDTVLVDRRDDGEAVLLAEREVLGAAPGGDVHDPGTFRGRHIGPGDDAVFHALLRGDVVERRMVPQAHKSLAEQPLDNLVIALECAECPFFQVQLLTALADPDVGEPGVHGGRDVAGERPGRGGPHEQRLSRPVRERKPHEDPAVRQLLVPFGGDLVLAQARGAPRAPRHHVVPLVDEATLVTAPQKAPDLVVVLVGEGKVRPADLRITQAPHDLLGRLPHLPPAPRGVVDRSGWAGLDRLGQPPEVVGSVPVHPHRESHRLLRLHGRVREHPVLAEVDERLDAVGLDVALAGEAEVFFHLDLDPQPLAVEAVLVALAEAAHRLVALKQVLIGAAPGVVHAHRVVGGDRAVEERPGSRRGLVAAQVLLEDALLLPPGQHLPLHRGEVHSR